jgi:endo-1,3-1,4-beta-glycanase ExoK
MTDFFFSDFTDTTQPAGYNPLIDNSKWRVSTWKGTGDNLFKAENCTFTPTVPGDNGRGYLHMTVRANTTTGAEIICTQESLFGYYEARMQCSSVWGACNAFFWIDFFAARRGEEIDCEFLTPDFCATPGKGILRCQLHPGNHGGPQALLANPAEGFHRVDFLWRPDRLDWVFDGKVIQTITDPAQVPKKKGHMFFNNWTGKKGWGEGPPAQDNTMIIDWCRYHPGATEIVPVPVRS